MKTNKSSMIIDPTANNGTLNIPSALNKGYIFYMVMFLNICENAAR